MPIGSKAVLAAIGADAAATALKFIAAAVTGSAGMLSQAIQSAVDTTNSGLLLLGMKLSRKPADRAHPMGHGRELYFWTMIVATVIFGMGGGINVFEGVSRVLHPQFARHLLWNYLVLGGAAVLDGGSFAFAARQYLRARAGPIDAGRPLRLSATARTRQPSRCSWKTGRICWGFWPPSWELA